MNTWFSVLPKRINHWNKNLVCYDLVVVNPERGQNQKSHHGLTTNHVLCGLIQRKSLTYGYQQIFALQTLDIKPRISQPKIFFFLSGPTIHSNEFYILYWEPLPPPPPPPPPPPISPSCCRSSHSSSMGFSFKPLALLSLLPSLTTRVKTTFVKDLDLVWTGTCALILHVDALPR